LKSLDQALSYLGRSFWGLRDPGAENQSFLDQGRRLYHWGNESGLLDDYEQSFSHLVKVPLEALSLTEALECHHMLFDNLIHMLKLRLKETCEVFDFLCVHRPKIEIRDLDFPKELHLKIEEFIKLEEQWLSNGQDLKKRLLGISLPESQINTRKNTLEHFERHLSEVEDGIEAFYHRVLTYIKSEN
jgi:hypothetical protein